MKHQKLEIIPTILFESFEEKLDFDISLGMKNKSEENLPFDYFEFYTSVSSVYSSKIEGEEVEMDSYFKHKFLDVKYEADYTKKADDLFDAYTFAEENGLNGANILEAHKILSRNLLASKERGRLRNNPMFVLDSNDRIEYVACSPFQVKTEYDKLFRDTSKLLEAELNLQEVFYFGAMIHLVFLKIHPLQDGNGRTARLLEKWFLTSKLGKEAIAIELEKNYYQNKPGYYNNIRKIGLEYETLDYSKALDFLLMTVQSLKK